MNARTIFVQIIIANQRPIKSAPSPQPPIDPIVFIFLPHRKEKKSPGQWFCLMGSSFLPILPPGEHSQERVGGRYVRFYDVRLLSTHYERHI